MGCFGRAARNIAVVLAGGFYAVSASGEPAPLHNGPLSPGDPGYSYSSAPPRSQASDSSAPQRASADEPSSYASSTAGAKTCSGSGEPCTTDADCGFADFCHFPGPDVIVGDIGSMGSPGTRLTCHDRGELCATAADCHTCTTVGGSCAADGDCLTCSAGGDRCALDDDCKTCTGSAAIRRCDDNSDCATCSISGDPCTGNVNCPDDVCVSVESCESVETCESVESCVATGEECDVPIAAFAVGTESCNIGDQPAQWSSLDRFHPVIAQNMYRLMEDRFEQVGMSWVKHGFFVQADDLCGICQNPNLTSALGAGCSDIYDAGLNGDRAHLGPRSDINAHTGMFVYPYDAPAFEGILSRRLQVHEDDLFDTDDNPAVLYFAEGHYVTSDDAQAGNGNNNASYNRIDVQAPGAAGPCGAAGPWKACVLGSTAVGQQGIRAWQDHDPEVLETEIQIPGEGLLILAAKAVDLGAGTWRYEYALLNFNSDRSVGLFSVPLPQLPTITNVGFHDVDHHSGEPYDGTDWPEAVEDGSITWATESFPTNPNANAIRWSTLYNFRFEVNAEPAESTTVTIGLFKPGSPTHVSAVSVGPVSFIDCNQNAIADACDLSCAPAGCDLVQKCGAIPADCDANGVLDECQVDCNANGSPDSCDLSARISTDCNGNSVPDECEIDAGSTAPGGPFFCAEFCAQDCDGNGRPDDCDAFPDEDEDGLIACADVCPDTNPGVTCDCTDAVGDCWFDGVCLVRDFQGSPIPADYCVDVFLGIPDCLASPYCRDGCLVGDGHENGNIDLRDLAGFQVCIGIESPAADYVECLRVYDFNADGAVDLQDFEEFHDLYFNGAPPSSGPCVSP